MQKHAAIRRTATLTKNEFRDTCREFVSLNQGAKQQGWEWNQELEFCHAEKIYYCPKHQIITTNVVDDNQNSYSTTVLEDEDDVEDEDPVPDISNFQQHAHATSSDSSSDNDGPSIPICFKYHIVYSESFQVPVLYFNAYNMADSSLLSTDTIFRIIAKKHESDGLIPQQFNPYTLITQGEHPALNSIFYYIHPCETANLMDLVSESLYNEAAMTTTTTTTSLNEDNSKSKPFNYITSWLSFIGRIVLFDVNLTYTSVLPELK